MGVSILQRITGVFRFFPGTQPSTLVQELSQSSVTIHIGMPKCKIMSHFQRAREITEGNRV